LGGARKEYSKYLQVFCMTFALKGRHQTEWDFEWERGKQRSWGFSSGPQVRLLRRWRWRWRWWWPCSGPGPGILWLQLIMQFAVGLLAAPWKSRIIWQDIYAALVAFAVAIALAKLGATGGVAASPGQLFSYESSFDLIYAPYGLTSCRSNCVICGLPVAEIRKILHFTHTIFEWTTVRNFNWIKQSAKPKPGPGFTKLN